VPTTTLNYAALTEPYNRAEGQALAATLRASGPTGRKYVGMGVAVDVIGSIAFAAVVLVMLPITIGGFVNYAQHPDRIDLSLPLTTLAVVVFSAAFLWWLLHRYLRRLGTPEIWWRLDRFARANGLAFAPWSPDPQFPSALFDAGPGAAAYNHLRRDGEQFFNIGNLYYQSGRAGMETFDQRWGFVAVYLEQEWPPLLLDAKANNRLGNTGLNVRISQSQPTPVTWQGSEDYVLWSREADIDRAEQAFTDDLIGALVTAKGTYDAHIDGRWLYFYSRSAFEMTDPALLAELFGLVDIVRTARL
jgi:hypothetical protein